MAARRTASLQQCFAQFDKDGSGTLSAKEFSAILTRKADEGANVRRSLTEEDAQELIALFDTDGDGQLSINEFVEAMAEMDEDEPELDLYTLPNDPRSYLVGVAPPMATAPAERCPFSFLTIESASVANPPRRYSMGNDFVLVFSLEETSKTELLRSEMSSEEAVFGPMSVPCPLGQSSLGLRIRMLQTGVYDKPSGVEQGVATIGWSEIPAQRGAITVPMSEGPVRSVNDDGESMHVHPSLTIRFSGVKIDGGLESC